MDKRELLGLLTSHGLDPGKVHGGAPEVTQMDVAGMMSRLSPCQSTLLRCKYSLEPIHDVWAYWFRHLMDQGWRSHKPGTIEALSRLTLAEHVSDNRCPLCDGTQGRVIGNRWVSCPGCEGAGITYLSDREVARRLGFANGKLQPPWIDRLAWCRRELIRWEHDALRAMTR